VEVPRVVPPDVVEPTPMPEGPVVAVAPGVVVTVPVGDTDIVPEPFSVAVDAVEPEVVVVVPLFVGDVVTVLGVTWPLGEVVPIDVCDDVLPAFVPGPVLVVVVVPAGPAGAPAVPPDMVCANEEPAPSARASAVMRILGFMDASRVRTRGKAVARCMPSVDPPKSRVNARTAPEFRVITSRGRE
jgi:hypothetical protein